LPEPSDNSGLLSKNVTRIKERGAVKHDKAQASPRPHVRCGREAGIRCHAQGDIRRLCIGHVRRFVFRRLEPFGRGRSARLGAGRKADRADARPLARACSGNAWPYFEASCLRDARNPFGYARDVRLISHDEAAAAKVKGKPAQ
jgi:hypothetical protein